MDLETPTYEINLTGGTRGLQGPEGKTVKEKSAKEKPVKQTEIIISNSGETKRLAELCTQADENNCDILSFTGDKNSTIAKHSTLAISSDTFNPTSFDSHYPQLFFGLTLIYFELLMSNFLSN